MSVMKTVVLTTSARLATVLGQKTGQVGHGLCQLRRDRTAADQRSRRPRPSWPETTSQPAGAPS